VLNAIRQDKIQHVVINGSAADETLSVDYTQGNPIPLGGLKFDGEGGLDTYVIAGTGVHLDLTDSASPQFSNVEVLNIIGHSPNTLTLDLQSVLDATDAGDTLVVISDLDDTVNIEGRWSFSGTTVNDGQFARIVTQGDATLHLIGPADWTNPLIPFDVNANGSVEPLDALVVINEVNDSGFSNTDHRLVQAAGLSTFPNFFYDVRADGFVVPLDVLAIINFLNSRAANAEGESADIVAENRTIELDSTSSTPLTSSVIWLAMDLESPAEEMPSLARAAEKSSGDSSLASPIADARRASERSSVSNDRSNEIASTDLLDAIDHVFAELELESGSAS
jgi:hypothetical protein